MAYLFWARGLIGIFAASHREEPHLPAPVVTDEPALSRLPLVTLYLTERCNSRCASCDYWRHGRDDLTLASVARLLPSLSQLQTQVVLLSGGEPLLNPEWATIAELLRHNGQQIWLLTSGLSLAKHARRAAARFDCITVSLDGTDAPTYAAIRGLDAFEAVCAGIRAAAKHGAPTHIRVTLQRANYTQLRAFVDLARDLGARSVSFLAVDVASENAFGRTTNFATDLALRPQDLAPFEQLIGRLERDYAADFSSGFIAESPRKLRRLLQYFSARHGLADYPPVRCNAPEFSAVIDAHGQVQPCFFIRGPPTAQLPGGEADPGTDLSTVLNRADFSALRSAIRSGARPECRTCVCSLWRESERFSIPIGAAAHRMTVEVSG
jgi:MoaA/NifB/PqqE/SkfB family radical SAM enzyme